MKPGFHAVNRLLRAVFSIPCLVHDGQLDRIPRQGPAIVIGNHINFLEAPVMMSWLDNPVVTGIAKRESWKSPLLKFLFDLWEIIPIDRGMVDREAFNLSLNALKQGKILAISPEGTRSGDGSLLKGKPGVSILAARSDAVLIPIAFWGHEGFWNNLKRLRRTHFYIAVGQPFRLTAEGSSTAREVREAVADEVMYKLAELLPEKYRGAYAFEDKPGYRYLIPAE